MTILEYIKTLLGFSVLFCGFAGFAMVVFVVSFFEFFNRLIGPYVYKLLSLHKGTIQTLRKH